MCHLSDHFIGQYVLNLLPNRLAYQSNFEWCVATSPNRYIKQTIIVRLHMNHADVVALVPEERVDVIYRRGHGDGSWHVYATCVYVPCTCSAFVISESCSFFPTNYIAWM